MFEDPNGDDLLTFLRVADKWQLEPQKESALKKLREVGTSFQHIVAGRLYDEAKGWIVPAFTTLSAKSPPTLEEATFLGLKDAIKLWHISHNVRNFKPNNIKDYIRKITTKTILITIENFFITDTQFER